MSDRHPAARRHVDDRRKTEGDVDVDEDAVISHKIASFTYGTLNSDDLAMIRDCISTTNTGYHRYDPHNLKRRLHDQIGWKLPWWTKDEVTSLAEAIMDHVYPKNLLQLEDMVNIDYLIDKSSLSHDYDVQSFVDEAEEVMQWHDRVAEEKEEKKKPTTNREDGPYFCIIQSSGMGKTKIMFEACQILTEHRHWTCRIVLSKSLRDRPDRPGGIFHVDPINVMDIVPSSSSVGEATGKVMIRLNEFVSTLLTGEDRDQKIFLCFDEAHAYLGTERFHGVDHPAFMYRCILSWLHGRQNRGKVAACFGGTTAALSKFRYEPDVTLSATAESTSTSTSRPFGSSRDFVPSPTTKVPRREKVVFPVFLQTTTMGCIRNLERRTPTGSGVARTEYRRSIEHGRPLFTFMEADDGKLDGCIWIILQRMLISTADWIDRTPLACLSILGTRVQMGQTSFEYASELVSRGYANLTNITKDTARICFLVDPVCARLAMCMMDKDWTYPVGPGRKIQGQDPIWWYQQLQTLYGDELCQPEEGDFGTVITALYLLLCGDVLRKQQDADYETFSVPLRSWIQVLLSGGKDQGEGERRSKTSSKKTETTTAAGPAGTTSRITRRSSKQRKPVSPKRPKQDDHRSTKDDGISVSFIQVCRNYIRSYEYDFDGLFEQGLLEFLYDSGCAFYTSPFCRTLDMVASIKMEKRAPNGESICHYAPLLMCIKASSYIAPDHAASICDCLVSNARKVPGKSKAALCLVIIFGSSVEADDGDDTLTADVVDSLRNDEIVGRVLRIPKDDAFHSTKVFANLTSGMRVGDEGELLASQSFARAYAHEDRDKGGETYLDPAKALRIRPSEGAKDLLANLKETTVESWSHLSKHSS